jgi:hypothetical protein
MTNRVAGFLRILVPVLIAAAVLLWWRAHGDRMVVVAPRVTLSWDARGWDILHDFTTPKGLEPLPGGIRVVEGVVALEVIDRRYLIGRKAAGRYSLMTVRELGRDEPSSELVRWFDSRDEWRDACRAAGIEYPRLREPAAVADPY